MGNANEAKKQVREAISTKDNNLGATAKMKRNFQLLLEACSIFFPPLRWPYRIEKRINGDIRIIDRFGHVVGSGKGL